MIASHLSGHGTAFIMHDPLPCCASAQLACLARSVESSVQHMAAHNDVCSVLLEEGFGQEAVQQLQRMGHLVRPGISGASREAFGRGQIIRRNPQTGVLMGGSDPRADGQALGW